MLTDLEKAEVADLRSAIDALMARLDRLIEERQAELRRADAQLVQRHPTRLTNGRNT